MVRTFLYILFFLVFYYVFTLFLKSLFGSGTKKTDPETEELVQDPCCLTYISRRIALKKRVSGRDVYFCREECFKRYLESRGTSKI